ncbi:hypothetical protein D3C87_1175600 [compost metagenome]
MAVVEACLGGNQFAGQQPVGFVPGGHQRRRGGVAQHGGNRFEQMLADDRVVRGGQTHGHVLVDNALHHGREHVGAVHIGGVGEHGRGERLLLRAIGLVAHVEQPGQFRPRGEHFAIEVRRDGKAVLTQHGNAGIDIGAGSCRQHLENSELSCMLDACFIAQ